MQSASLCVRPLLACLFAALLALPAAAQEPEAAPPDHAGHAPSIVGITSDRLLPTVVEITPTDSFGWLNYSARAAAISFDDAVVEHMTCRAPGPFQLRGDQLMAPKVASGDFATLCSLAPGEYDYRVELKGRDEVLVGKIVVREEA